MASEDTWKQKYLEEVSAAELRQRHWEETRYTLERLLVRTSLASEGQEAELDNVLGQLRNQLRKGEADISQLQALQLAIDEHVVALDRRKAQSSKQLQQALARLITARRDHPSFASERLALKQLDKALGKPETFQDALPQWLQALTEMEARVLAGETKQATGVVGRWFGRKSPAAPVQSEPTEPRVSENPREDPASTAIYKQSSHAHLESDQRVRFARRVSDILEHLVKQVSLSPPAHSRALLLRDTLAKSEDWDELRDSLREIADLVVAAVSHGQQEFEAFLARLDERLELLQGHFVVQAGLSLERQHAVEALDQTLSADLRALGREVDAAKDLDTLKQSVGHHIDSLTSAVRSHQASEGHRDALLSAEIEAVKQKLAAAEAHSEQMQQRLRDERARALTDVLTQLPNREAWQERLAFEYTRWQRYGHPVTLCVLDIDHFKRVNDSFGHKAGDRVIQLMARTLQERLRTTDFAARYGGEEFVVLLPETDLEKACIVIDTLRAQVAELPFHFQGQPVNVTFSAGLAPFTEGAEADVVFDIADKALYRAKDGGRNRVCRAEF